MEERRKVCPFFGQKCTFKIKHYCCKPKNRECYKEENSLAELEKLMIENADVLKRLKER